MMTLTRSLAFTAALGVAGLAATNLLSADPPKPAQPPAAAAADPAPVPVKVTDARVELKYAVNPKPLSAAVKNGLQYLVKTQQDDGGWNQGGGWRTNTRGSGRVEGKTVEDPSDVGNSCFALLALIRSGSNPTAGEHKDAVAKGLRFVLGRVEKADKDSLYVTDVRGTQLQSKIGQYVDTFLVNLVLAELKGKAGPEEARLSAALEKTMNKIVKHQTAEGGFAGNAGWAPVLSVGLANKGIAKAQQNGVQVDDRVLRRAFSQSRMAAGQPAAAGVAAASTAVATGRVTTPGAVPTLEAGRAAIASAPATAGSAVASRPAVPPATGPAPVGGPAGALAAKPADGRLTRGAMPAPGFGGGFGGAGGGAGFGDAGVTLYRFGQGAGNTQDVVNSLRIDGARAREVMKDAKASKADKLKAEQKLVELRVAEGENAKVQRDLATNVQNRAFVAGFGSNGGEEFLSFLNISEALVVKGGKEWTAWDEKMQKGLEKAQDKDGSWNGHHCITGKTFCTAGALLVLMADRTQFPAEVLDKATQPQDEPKPAKAAPPTGAAPVPEKK